MNYSLKAKRHSIELLKEEAWRVIGGPKRILTDDELSHLLCISTSSLARVKAGGKVPSIMVAGIIKVFHGYPDITDDLWYVDEPEAVAA